MALPTPDRKASGFLLQVREQAFLVDGGSGTLQALVQQGVNPQDLNAGIYTHRHPDHTGDLASVLFAMRVAGRTGVNADYPIFAAEGFADFLARLKACYPKWLEGHGWTARVNELPLESPGKAVLPGEVELTTMPANHSGGALHLRLNAGGRSIVFSGDTGPSEALVELAEGADLLVCECALSMPSASVRHLWPGAVRKILAQAKPKYALLTHFYEEVDEREALVEARKSGVRVDRAFDGQQIEV